MAGELVLVTGGSGFLGAHCVLRLLDDGYRVRTTVRSPDKEPSVRAMLKADAGTDSLAFATADLTSDSGWREAAEGCAFVLHTASPFPAYIPAHEDELIIPARDGTLRVLRAARDAEVGRVVLTSSFAAIGYGHPPTSRPFGEETWTELNDGLSAYTKSKTIAERAAWDLSAQGGPELSVINPTVIFGPVLAPGYSSSVEIIARLMRGSVPALPKVSFGVVDVRDVADLHVRAMTSPVAGGERFLATAGLMSLREVALVLRKSTGRRVPVLQLPDWVIRLAATAVLEARMAVSELGTVRLPGSDKAARMLGWAPRPKEEAVVATAQSLQELSKTTGG